jgi:hypothetical protein
MSHKDIRAHWVPEDGISREVLDDKLAAFFGLGARVGEKIRFGEGGEVGWFVAGGRVTKPIIDDLRRETRRREQRAADTGGFQATPTPVSQFPGQPLSNTNSQRSTISETGRSSSSVPKRHGSSQPGSTNRTAAERDHSQQTGGRHSAVLAIPSALNSDLPPPDNEPHFDPSNPGRYPQTDAIDIPRRETRHPPTGSVTDHAPQSSFGNRHERQLTTSTDPAYPLEDAVRSRGSETSRRGSGRDDEEDDEPPYGGKSTTYGTRHTSERSAEADRNIRNTVRNLGRDEDDEDPNQPAPYGSSRDMTGTERPRPHRDDSRTDRHKDPVPRKPVENKPSPRHQPRK